MSKNMKDTELNQHARFLETARALGCDEDKVAFDEKLRSIVRRSREESIDENVVKKEDN